MWEDPSNGWESERLYHGVARTAGRMSVHGKCSWERIGLDRRRE